MIMKKILLSTLLIVLITVSYLFYDEFSFSPLNNSDFKKLFKEYDGSFEKHCSKNFLGINFRGELFDIFKYNTTNPIISKNFPEITEWENKMFTNETVVGKWMNCPIDHHTAELYKFVLTSNNFHEASCCSSFNKEILNSNNYYSYIYFNELEQYFLLFCTNSQELYYIRKKGF